ncbi:hypothetical protein ACN47E_005873 [Coniothyrium glycines]
MLRRLHQHMAQHHESTLGRPRTKRQRILHFFRHWRQKPLSHNDAPGPYPGREKSETKGQPAELANDSPLEQRNGHINEMRLSPADEVEGLALPPLPSKARDREESQVSTMTEEELHSLFAGAPQFHVDYTARRPVPVASYPWDKDDGLEDSSDSVHPTEAALAAATLHPSSHPQDQQGQKKAYNGYHPDVDELPSMYSAQGVEPGTTGLCYFLQLPVADTLATNLEQSQSSRDFLEATRNKQVLQSNPERLGIRQVNMDLVYDRLIELQDIYETFQDTPEPMTILNNQSSGDLYANLFTKFLTPPGHDDSIQDPTGLQLQISTLIRILKLKGVWYDFSLVEWRIRLGQVLWSEPEPVPEYEAHPMWTEREVLLLQVTLSCELLLRLDAFTNVDAIDAELRLQIDPKDINGFMKSKNRKVNWDLVLARRFLDNVSVMKGSDAEGMTLQATSRGLLSLLGRGYPSAVPASDLILLPQHQTRQLSGLLYFAKTISWPDAVSVTTDLARKLGAASKKAEFVPNLSPRLSDPTTPSVISVYGTPLQTPRPSSHVNDSYFNHVGKPTLTRNDSRTLRIPLSPTWSSSEEHSEPSLDNVGGWLSRSYLTGLILPGEAISHFLISTLLENDRSAISSLGDSANLYGGFTYSGRTFWSKNSVVGRVLACVDGSVECMGWISSPKLPANLTGWHSIHSEQLPCEGRIRKAADSDVVAIDSAIVPEGMGISIRSEDLLLPLDPVSPSDISLTFLSWELTPINPDLIDDDDLIGPPTESDIHVASFTFASKVQHTYTLAYDVQFVSSWPCNPPTSRITRPSSVRPDLRRAVTGTLSRSSSKRSETLSRRNSHGFEPLLSHPPDSTAITPRRTYDAVPEDTPASQPKNQSVAAHFLHASYLHKIVPVTDILNSDFELTFDMHTSKSSERLLSSIPGVSNDEGVIKNSKKTVLVLDARGPPALELLARAWCAEKGLHAVIGRTGRTCLACCIREARGLGMNIVIRV